MSDIIRLLPESLANQIAAGEVVQRPASVVKELLENSVDAGASTIELHVKDSGKTSIQVIDDGVGMSETDARMSFERHATSKITRTEDLFKIKTFGFRGEALASIAAVSQVELKTRQSDEDLGSVIYIEGSEIEKQEPVSTSRGTKVIVKNLFFNVPARRNFLKSNPVEFKHIVDEFSRVALANPSISFRLCHNEQEIYHLPEGKLSQRIINLFGEGYKKNLISVKEETPTMSIFGYIGNPQAAKKSRGEQFFFVNNRFIKSNYLNHAVLNAYEGLIPEGTFPFFSLYLSLAPEKIDINVHPTKTEIKFDDERTVYGIVKAAVKQALATHNMAPSIDFETDVNFNLTNQPRQKSFAKGDRDYSNFKTLGNKKENLENWEKLYQIYQKDGGQPDPDQSDLLTFESAANQPREENRGQATEPKPGSIFQLHRKYILSQVKSGIMVINQELAHERILYDFFLDCIENKTGCTQQSLFPITIELGTSDFALVQGLDEEIKSLGFSFEVFGKSSIKIDGIPADIKSMGEKELFEGLIEQFKNNQESLALPKKESLARAMAKRSSIKSGKSLEAEEMNSLIDGLFGSKNPNYAPDGRRTFFILGLDEIEESFK